MSARAQDRSIRFDQGGDPFRRSRTEPPGPVESVHRAAPAVRNGRLFGRDPELATLTAAISGTVAGRGHLYLVSGEPGVLHSTPLLVVAADREAEAGHASVLAGRLGELARLSTPILLRGLDPGASRALVSAVSGREPSDRLALVLHEATGGNPFFLDEVVRLLLAEERFDDANVGSRRLGVPDRVRGAIQARLTPLSAASRAALQTAAALGQEFDADLLAAVLGLTPADASAALEAPLSRGFVRAPPGGNLRFAHSLIRETLYGGLAAAERVGLHSRIGAALEARQAHHPEAALAALAHHFLLGQPEADAGRAVQYARRAGEQALMQCGYENAAAYFEQALGLFDRGAPSAAAERGELLLDLGRTYARASVPEAAQRAITAAAAEGRRRCSPRPPSPCASASTAPPPTRTASHCSRRRWREWEGRRARSAPACSPISPGSSATPPPPCTATR